MSLLSSCPLMSYTYRPGFLNLGTTDIAGGRLFVAEDSVHCRMLISIPGLYALPFMSGSIPQCMWFSLLRNLFVGKWGGSCVCVVFPVLPGVRREKGGKKGLNRKGIGEWVWTVGVNHSDPIVLTGQRLLALCSFVHTCSVTSLVSDSLRPYGLRTARFLWCGILQARILEWVATSYSKGSF